MSTSNTEVFILTRIGSDVELKNLSKKFLFNSNNVYKTIIVYEAYKISKSPNLEIY